MKKLHLILTAVILLSTQLLKAEDTIYFHPQSDQLTVFTVENTSQEMQDLWVLVYDKTFLDEYHFAIPAKSQMKIPVHHYKQSHQDFSVLIKNKSLKLSQDFQNVTSTRFQKNLIPHQQIQLTVLNLWVQEQNIQVEFLNSRDQIVSTHFFKSNSYMKSSLIEVIAPAESFKLRVKAQNKIAFPAQDQMQALVDTTRKPAFSDEPTAYFLIANGDQSSFVAPIRNPELIDRARKEIENYQGYMIFADIDFNESDINRNHLGPLKNYWSWKITEVTAIAQIGADWCQVYPEMIERMLHQLIDQKRVCFRGQRIIRELKPSEL